MRGKRVWHFARKTRGYRPTFFFAKSTWEACVGRSFPSSFSFLRHFFLFPVFLASLGRDEDAGKSLQGCCGVVCGWVSLGDPTFSASGHPTHSLGLPIESQTLTLTLWATQWVSGGCLGFSRVFWTLGNPRKPSEHPAHTPLASTHGRLLHSSLLMSRGTWP